MTSAITWAVRFRLAQPRSFWRKVPLFVLVRIYVARYYLRAFFR